VTGTLAAGPVAAAVLANGQVTTGEAVVFWILAPLALAGAIGMVLARNAVHSALCLVMTMFSLGVFYVVESGPFIGMVQIIVYTGAIMILFLFVLMLVGRDSADSIIETLRGQRVAAALFGIGFAFLVTLALARALSSVQVRGLDPTTGYTGNVQQIAGLLFTRYVFAFEVTSALLITAAVGAMVLAHVERPREGRVTQRELSRRRFRGGGYPGPLPGPGVFATSDSVATPALLPDGTAAGTSIDAVIEPLSLGQARSKDQT
jgi:NADH-quinone oxidoreductase subunit J